MTATRQAGMFLLEALVAIVVLSFGLLGLLGLVANALHASGGVGWRQQAFDIGASTLSQMWAENPSVLASRYDAQGLLDLVFTVGQYHLVSFALNAFGVERDDGLDASAIPFPDPA